LTSKVIGNLGNQYQRVVLQAKYLPKVQEVFREYQFFINTIIEGCFLGNYTFDKFQEADNSVKFKDLNLRTSNSPKFVVVDILIQEEIPNELIKTNYKIFDTLEFTRDLINMPANILHTTEFVERIKNHFSKSNVKVEVYDKKWLENNKMNAILSVGKGSKNPPFLVKLHYKPQKKNNLTKIALVGKGVVYDSGGYSIKPTASMLDMKIDMAGAAVVAGIISVASKIELDFELIGFLPIAENMIDGNSLKPGDIISSKSGKTIEIMDTDAEGRLILADALEFAQEFNPDFIFDFATLTGAAVVALGESISAIFTQNKEIAELLMHSSDSTYERIWQLPLPNDYKNMLKSEIADLKNLGERWGGAITAALFLQYFIEKDNQNNWVHFDIAGPTSKHKQAFYTNKSATGFGVRLIIDFLRNWNFSK
jgi:leucyl aminopeptidase